MKFEQAEGLTEEYVVKYWHKSFTSGFWEQAEVSVFTEDGKDLHQQVEDFVKKNLKLQDIGIVSVTYC
jgi:hypothetical protein